MFNPFVLLSEKLLRALVESGKRYFVRQTFDRGKAFTGKEVNGSFLFTHYATFGPAQAHFGALNRDIYRKLYDWNDPADREKLLIASRYPAGYRIYSALFHPQWQTGFTDGFRKKLRCYIQTKLDWAPEKGETVKPDIYLEFGELYTKLTFQSQEVRVKLDEIENLT